MRTNGMSHILKYVLLFVSLFTIETYAKEEDSIVVKTFTQNLKVIDSALNTLKNNIEVLRVDDVDIAYLYKIVTNGSNGSYNNFNTLAVLHALHRIGFYHNFNRYIEDTAITQVILTGITSTSKEAYDITLNYLFNDIRPDYARALSVDIKTYLKNSKFLSIGDSLAILRYLDLSKEELRTLLPKVNQKDIYARADFGDNTCIDSLIYLFTKETDYRQKASYANTLGYIGTEKCAIALLNAMDSKIVLQSSKTILSIRVPIIMALGRIHPENKLLTNEITKIKRFSDAAYTEGIGDVYKITSNSKRAMRIIELNELDTTETLKQKETIRNYLSSIIKWGKETYKNQITIDTCDTFLKKTFNYETTW